MDSAFALEAKANSDVFLKQNAALEIYRGKIKASNTVREKKI